MQKIIISVFITILVGSIISRCNQSKTQTITQDKQQNSIHTTTPLNGEPEADIEYGNINKPMDINKITQCSELINEYATFANEFTRIVQQHMANPTNVPLMKKYAEVMAKASEWEEKTKDCAFDSTTTKQITTIQLQIDHIASGM